MKELLDMNTLCLYCNEIGEYEDSSGNPICDSCADSRCSRCLQGEQDYEIGTESICIECLNDKLIGNN